MEKIAVLLVCHANICRSPMAEGILKHLVAERGLSKSIRVDSAGTHAGLFSSRPDLRAQRICQAQGIDIKKIKSRKLKAADFKRSDHILVMDQRNLDSVMEKCPEEFVHKVSLLLTHSLQPELREVPDPYYGSEKGFEYVFELIKPALIQFLDGHLH